MILFCDFDGTLHRRGKEDEFAQNLVAVKRWRKAGNKFVLITGRGLASVKRGFPQYAEYVDYLICDNGSLCFDQNGVFFEHTMDRGLVQELLDYLHTLPESEKFDYIFYRDGEEFAELGDVQTKVRVWTCDNDMADVVGEKLCKHFDGKPLRFFPGHNVLPSLPITRKNHRSIVDVVSAEAGKDNALGRIAALYPDEPVYAVGDGFNDMAMLAQYNGFVMKSAKPERVAQFDAEHQTETVGALINKLMGATLTSEQLLIVHDIERQLCVRAHDLPVTFYTDGATDATVFSLGNQYLVKVTDLQTIQTQKEFLMRVPEGVFQKLLCWNEGLRYECFEFIEGVHFDGELIEPRDAVEQIAAIVKSYPEYPNEQYGFLGDEKASWREFLLDEVDYAKRTIFDVSQEKVLAAIDSIGDAQPKQYLMHGDFGTHNFLLSNGKIRVIDPMPVIGDRLYDFYFAILSNVGIFTKLGMDYYLSFFDEYEIEYKKALLVVALYVRMSRAAKYDAANLDKYIQLYNGLNEF